jgi:LPXTG-motif cell wall-anchored protein
MLNENAVIADGGNKNTANVEYSNDPSNTNSTGTSTDSETKTYTYEITIDKHDSANYHLAGAVFQLKNASNAVINLVKVSDGDANNAAVYRVATSADSSDTVVNTVTTPLSGHVVIKGLKQGTYRLEETVAPTGYNKLGTAIAIAIAPSQTGSDENITYNYSTPIYTVSGTSQGTSSIINVVNTKGAVLPVTGGIGTIGLTVLGAGVVILGILLTSRKKKSAKAE